METLSIRETRGCGVWKSLVLYLHFFFSNVTIVLLREEPEPHFASRAARHQISKPDNCTTQIVSVTNIMIFKKAEKMSALLYFAIDVTCAQ